MIYSHLARKPRIAPELRDSANINSAEDLIIAQARDILIRRLGATKQDALSSPQAVRAYLQLTLGTLEREEFWCLWLDAPHRGPPGRNLHQYSQRRYARTRSFHHRRHVYAELC